MRKELPKVYEPKDAEGRIYDMWIKGGYFKGVIDPSKKPFTIVIPPPNVTGQLHLGHAFDETLQDILIRTKRMQGYAALWMPGTDHAGIATQIKVEENLRLSKGLTKYDIGREEFIKLVWQWKEKYGGRIIEQLKKLGSSCDWERERFTMDDGCSRAVREVFVSMYEKGLIYKGSRIINWCPDCATALSDAEVSYNEKDGHFWHIKYPVKDSSEFVTIATTRPETMLGDMAVAVNPDDKRYTHLIGKTLILPLMNREIPVIADEYVEMDFGTGCVKITPYHDPNDYEVAKRHNIDGILVMDDCATINSNGGKYEGLYRYDARKKIVEDLTELGLIQKIEEHKHNVGECYRCNTVVEPINSSQWFVKMEPIAKEAIRVVEDKTIKFVPDRFSKIYLNWMENVHDWCISRQLWWGHRIPAFYCGDCGNVEVSREDAALCSKCGSENITQDEDVLDTWFSSALWPFSTLGWPDKTPELSYFYPTDVLVTGYDIIFFWVARMIFSGLEHTGREPFHTVFIHGLIRDEKGKKMSKSAGNGVDPIDVIDTYGADALRFNIITGNSPGNDMRFYMERCEAMRNFANKIWNAARFVQMNLTIESVSLPEKLELPDKWILSKLNSLIPEITSNIDRYELGVAAQKIYDFIWDNFCDWYIELSKARLTGDDEASKLGVQNVLCYTLDKTLKLLHPFMPFITEEVWQALPYDGPSIMIEKWPEADERLSFPDEEADMEAIMQLIRAVRVRRNEMNVPPSKKATLYIVTKRTDIFSKGVPFIKRLAYSSETVITDAAPDGHESMVSVVTEAASVFMPLSELIDLEKEKERIKKELDTAQKDLERINAKLNNPDFTAKAPENVVAAEREKADRLLKLIEKLKENEDRLR